MVFVIIIIIGVILLIWLQSSIDKDGKASGHNICPNRSSERASKGKGKPCPLPGRDHGDSKQQQLESQGISLDHHRIDILTLIFT